MSKQEEKQEDKKIKEDNLLDACKDGELFKVQELVGQGVDPHCRDGSGYTPLHGAAAKGHRNVVIYLREDVKVQVDITDNEGKTPFHVACQAGRLQVVKYLASDREVDVNIRDHEGMTPLHYACMKGKLEVVDYLAREMSAKTDATNDDGKTPLHWACENDLLDVVNFLLKSKLCDVDVSIAGNNGLSVLHYACLNGWLEVIKSLIVEKKMDPRTKGNDEKTLLHLAAEKGHLEVVKYLEKELKMSTDAKDAKGKTPFHWACEKGSVVVAKHLARDLDVILNGRDHDGRTPLHYACMEGCVAVVESLVKIIESLKLKGQVVDLNVADNVGKTPLHYACQDGCFRLVQILTKTKGLQVDPDIADYEGKTPLHYACLHGHFKVVQFLTMNLKVALEPDHNERMPLHYACMYGQRDIVMHLVNECKCDPYVPDGKEKKTPLDLYSTIGKASIELVDELKRVAKTSDSTGAMKHTDSTIVKYSETQVEATSVHPLPEDESPTVLETLRSYQKKPAETNAEFPESNKEKVVQHAAIHASNKYVLFNVGEGANNKRHLSLKPAGRMNKAQLKPLGGGIPWEFISSHDKKGFTLQAKVGKGNAYFIAVSSKNVPVLDTDERHAAVFEFQAAPNGSKDEFQVYHHDQIRKTTGYLNVSPDGKTIILAEFGKPSRWKVVAYDPKSGTHGIECHLYIHKYERLDPILCRKVATSKTKISKDYQYITGFDTSNEIIDLCGFEKMQESTHSAGASASVGAAANLFNIAFGASYGYSKTSSTKQYSQTQALKGLAMHESRQVTMKYEVGPGEEIYQEILVVEVYRAWSVKETGQPFFVEKKKVIENRTATIKEVQN